MKQRYNEFNNYEFEAHRLCLDLIDNGSSVLDVGCATGYFARELLKKNCEIWGLDSDKNAIAQAKKYCQKAFVFNADKDIILTVPKSHFDWVIILDVIEHLLYPQRILAMIKPHLKQGGKVIVSTPNISHASIRWMLFKGEFRYTDTGILDNTHVHFYTQKSFAYFLKKAGFRILKMLPTNGMCKVPLLYKITDRLPRSWQYWIVRQAPNLFSNQFIAVVKPLKHQ